ncbi:GNAT family N-acetyltransferase [Lactobacillus ultunensis]|uniref:Acetyltransferase, GNAT family n=1 Tax=Lactobacillus ultunensis DSM 16047 TaxID=525365 RepID=C2ENH1_9LACO|nr:GNAT family N-acetyltransferase [Lactobacillus ultunensis]EEJ71975.1 acetyltransferase, GNAT family [Lactobacillus ultunensis DSM 16047]KRL81999.1 acetyltransferase [Lactobacillus ultunensis DSM 16047]QQP27625.1 GNAT family N-acetyltransferase [Lactobacillus ultunensis]
MSLVYIRQAAKNDLDEIMPIIDEAKRFLKEDGNPQWQSGYPDSATISSDIENGEAWVLIVNQNIAGYTAVTSGPDPNYHQIDGRWKNDLDPYVAIHRVAISNEYRGMHLASYLLSSLISMHYDQGVRNYRVDTFRTNEIVQHLVEDSGFTERGTIKNDDPIDPYRVAYELNL